MAVAGRLTAHPCDHSAANPLRIGIVAGEPSGDLLGAALVEALSRRLPHARFLGIAGPRMVAAGVESLFPMSALAVRGYVEVARHYLRILAIRRGLRKRFLSAPPDIFIGVDAPDFNLGLELALRRSGMTTVHFVCPSIWAWRYERIHKIRKAVSHMLALFPFEAGLLEREKIPATFVGHPLADSLDFDPDSRLLREQLKIPASGPVVALLPGSRVSELQQLGELFVQTAKVIAQRIEGVTFLVPLVSRETRQCFEQVLARHDLGDMRLQVLFGHAHDAIGAADAVLVASGTATLETALIGRPMVIAYRMPSLSWRIIKRKATISFGGLPNILAAESIVPEFFQEEATAMNLAQAMCNLLNDRIVQDRLRVRFAQLRSDLRKGAAENAAQVICRLIAKA